APLVPKLRKNRTAHTDYIRLTQEEAATLREILEMPPREPIPIVNSIDKPVVTLVFQIVLWYLDSECSMHMTGDRSQLINFIQKFLGTVKFRNDHVAKIMGYGDYKIGNVTMSRVYFVEGLGHNLFSASKTKSGLWHRCLSHLNFGAINHLARQGLVREAVATACYTQNRSIIRLRHGKTPYELLHYKLPDLSFLYVFGALYYPTNDSKNLGKLQPKADIGIFIGYAPTKKAFWIYNRRTRRIVETIHVDFDELTAMASRQSSSGPALNEMTPATISSRLPFEITLFELIKLIIVSSHRYPIQVLIVMSLYNLEFSDSDDSSFRIHIASRLPVNNKTIELLMFTPSMGDFPEGMLVIAYWFFNPYCPRHQVFYPLDMPPAQSYSNHDSEMVVSVVEKTIQDAKRIVQLFDLQHLCQTLDVRALPSDRWSA
nr:retrovirus-related Pol polyprotein from transposon TNT 1-94 [Tanacetum cinerariifolium]